MKEKITGLTAQEVLKRQKQFGKNELEKIKKENFFFKIIHVLLEPMFLLLISASLLYFLFGEIRDGIIMLMFVIVIISIEIFQEWKTDHTLKALKELSSPKVKVIRDGTEKEITSIDLVPDDIMIIEEGCKVPADGIIIECNDLLINESTLTGETLGVYKSLGQDNEDNYWRQDCCYAGTSVIQGSAKIRVIAIGAKTEFGKISVDLKEIKKSKTPLEKQISKLVKLCASIAIILFMIVTLITYYNLLELPFNQRIAESILSGITLAMAMIPEEFPVVLAVFLTLGVARLAKKKSIVRKMSSIETLGAISVLCVDKTGTLTLNQMKVSEMFNFIEDAQFINNNIVLACEVDPYDPLEIALINYTIEQGVNIEELRTAHLVKEYSFNNENKIMGHLWEIDGCYHLCAKGSPESIVEICKLNKEDLIAINNKIEQMTKNGMRVIALANSILNSREKICTNLNDYQLNFLGLIALNDPLRNNMEENISTCQKAGIRIIMITGDNGNTASNIARQIGIHDADNVIIGKQLESVTDDQLQKVVKNCSIYARVVPHHKLKIVRALQAQGEIVAMTGDGVNDAPALKAADIGIAMGKRGNEVSRDASDLILMDDNFSTIIDTIKDGRKIYDNIKKAVGYILAIHIPIALSSLFGPILGISSASLMLLPLHVVLLELIIDPTCSIVLERQPPEDDILLKKPRQSNEKLISWPFLIKSLIQGLIIFIGSFGLYYYYINTGNDELLARTIGIMTIIFANIFLVIGNCSPNEFIHRSFIKLAKDKIMWGASLLMVIMISAALYSPLNEILKLKPLQVNEILIAILIASMSVLWYEIVKIFKKIRSK